MELLKLGEQPTDVFGMLEQVQVHGEDVVSSAGFRSNGLA
jgi:hypothetical protein